MCVYIYIYIYILFLIEPILKELLNYYSFTDFIYYFVYLIAIIILLSYIYFYYSFIIIYLLVLSIYYHISTISTFLLINNKKAIARATRAFKFRRHGMIKDGYVSEMYGMNAFCCDSCCTRNACVEHVASRR